jgi:L-ribulose-5-phosphate 3-epimerase
MRRIAIMQGRLVPPEAGRFQCFPRERWRDEFANGTAAGLDAIEWIYDQHGADVNPLATDAGLAEMAELSRHSGVVVVSVCADYFMDHPFVKANAAAFAEIEARLRWLLGRCHLAGITRMVLPFVDASKIESAGDETRVVEMLWRVLPEAQRCGVEIHLETSYGPAELAALLDRLPHPMLKANYDSGNSSSLGYDVRAELAAYGPCIGSVHIKDRVCGGSTVPLGAGDADIPALLEGLVRLKYAGDFVLQVARGESGQEVEWARQNRDYLLLGLRTAAGGVR